MRRHKVTRACCHSRAKTTLDAIALGRIPGFLRDGEANAGVRLWRGYSLQPKRRTPGAIAPGGSLELRTLGEPTQLCGRLIHGRHPATRP
jgi:hypothetical protein